MTYDLVQGIATLRLGRQDLPSRVENKEGEAGQTLTYNSSFTVSPEDPARAVLKARAVYDFERPPFKVRVESNEVTTSDAANFHHETTIEIQLDGKPFFHKAWSTQVPRMLN